jgi:hypothetical protein
MRLKIDVTNSRFLGTNPTPGLIRKMDLPNNGQVTIDAIVASDQDRSPQMLRNNLTTTILKRFTRFHAPTLSINLPKHNAID